MSDKIRVRLLNDGGYLGMEMVNFPVEVMARSDRWGFIAFICESELKRVGARDFFPSEDDGWAFVFGLQCEVIE